jgi:hypothetical protein
MIKTGLLAAAALLLAAAPLSAQDKKPSAPASRATTEQNAGAGKVDSGIQDHGGRNGQQQPQGATGAIDTTQAGAPAGRPEGETPPGMQAMPYGGSGQTLTGNGSGQ